MDEVDRPQPGGAGCGHYFYPTCEDAVLSGHSIAAQLSAVTGVVEIKARTKKSNSFLGIQISGFRFQVSGLDLIRVIRG